MRTRSSVLTSIALVALGVFVARLPDSIGQVVGQSTFFDPIIDVQYLISERYVEAPDAQALQRGAIQGMIDALDDPYTEYIPPADKAEFDKEMTGQYVGIGAQVSVQDGWLTVVTPMEDSPAYLAGVLAGDRIVEIDGEPTFQKSIDQSVRRLTGSPGTPVSIVLEREGTKIPMTLTRQRIVARMVKGFRRVPGGGEGAGSGGGTVRADGTGGERWDYMIDPGSAIAYLRLAQFTPTAFDELEGALREIGADAGRVRGLVLDLRGNPGGLLDQAVRIADLFLSSGTIVSTRGRARAGETAVAEADGTLPEFPIAIVVDGSSASASEVLAGALADNGRAAIVGTRTFGKGVVQALEPLPKGNGAQLKITEQHYYLPSGRLIHRTDDAKEWGVDPTPGLYVPLSVDELREMLLARQRREIIGLNANGGAGAGEARWADPEWIRTEMKDPQLAAALRAVQTKLASGSWTTGPVAAAQEQAGSIARTEITRLESARDRLERELSRLDRQIEALATTGVGATPTGPREPLWDLRREVAGGRVEVFDRSGARVVALDITSNDLHRWLVDAPLKPGAPEPVPPAGN